MNHGVTSVAENPNAATGTNGAMILATVVLLSTAILTMATLEYPYIPANATSMTNVNHIDAMHNTRCDGDMCQTITCINNNCQSISTHANHPQTSNQVANQPQTANQVANQPQTSNQVANQPQTSNQGLASTTPCYLPCLPSR
ncbi:MAG: hypothetical protein WB988_19050 [Candidatus Nitrosopolaris sp.]